jgi:U4/U6 small nuclear ribonucleoprotein PRP3
MVPKFTSVKANARFAGAAAASTAEGKVPTIAPRIAPSLNPYTSAGSAAATTTASGSASPATAQTAIPDLPSSLFARRAKPSLKFNQKGKYIQRAEEMRHEAKMEALRQRIAENARKAGLDSEFEVLERSVKRQPPPEVEWWDAPLLRNSKYEDLDEGMKDGTIVYDEGNQHVTLFVQHPIPIPAPWEGKMPELRGLMLTKKVRLAIAGVAGG